MICVKKATAFVLAFLFRPVDNFQLQFYLAIKKSYRRHYDAVNKKRKCPPENIFVDIFVFLRHFISRTTDTGKLIFEFIRIINNFLLFSHELPFKNGISGKILSYADRESNLSCLYCPSIFRKSLILPQKQKSRVVESDSTQRKNALLRRFFIYIFPLIQLLSALFISLLRFMISSEKSRQRSARL